MDNILAPATISKKVFNQGNLIISHQYDPSNQIEMAETSHHLLCYLLTGKHTRKITRIGDYEYTDNINSGDICLKPASHSGFWSWEEPDDSLVFLINPAFLYTIAEQNNFKNLAQLELKAIPNYTDTQLQNLMALFKQEIEANYSEGCMYQESLSNLLGIYLLRHYCTFPNQPVSYQGGLPKYKLKQITDYMNEHLADDISLGELANWLNMSQSHFSTLFRRSTGKSPYKFLLQQRLTRAQELLLNTNMAIADIAIKVGFYDQSHLSRHMKKSRGVSPRQLRLQA